MDKQKLSLYAYTALVTLANLYLWGNIVQGGAPRSGRVAGLIIMLAIGAVFADKMSHKPYVPEFIRAGCLVGLTLMYFFLFNLSPE